MATRNRARSSTSKKLTSDQVAENIKEAARKIRETSRAVRESVKTLSESGAIQEMADATHEGSYSS
jgi:predicted transcriptional regulator